MKQFTLGICAMESKATSPPMIAILNLLNMTKDFDIIVFPENIILNSPIEEWPIVDCLISFHSTGFPLSKAIDYYNMHKPIILNSLEKQKLFRSRYQVYQELMKCKIPHPNYILVDHEAIRRGEHTFEEHPNYILFDNIRLNKPFIEKPINAEDHNNWIYYPMSAGGGCKKLFRKVQDRSSEYCADLNKVRKDGVYLYEEFMSTFGTDIKVYTVGQMFAHAEARKAPTLDGRVWRTPDGKEIRYPIILTEIEKIIAYRVVSHFDQTICGFDILRTTNGPYVCDINGWSFVKGNKKYYRDCSRIIRIMFLLKLEEKYRIIFRNVIPHSFVTQETEELFKRTFDKNVSKFKLDDSEELCSVIVVMRHGDRTPKQKHKFYCNSPLLLSFFINHHNKQEQSPTEDNEPIARTSQIKLKTSEELTALMLTNKEIISDIKSKCINKAYLQNHIILDDVLKSRNEFTGINRKVQLKAIFNDSGTIEKILVVVKWGGELTDVGRIQAEDLGKRLRASLYPGDSTGLIRLHSTYRHDLKIYTSDEGRCQITSAAFIKGILDLEGELPPILASMTLRNDKSYALLDESVTVPERNDCKIRLQELLKLRSKIIKPTVDDIDMMLESFNIPPEDKPYYASLLVDMDSLTLTLDVVNEFLSALGKEISVASDPVNGDPELAKVLDDITSRWVNIIHKWNLSSWKNKEKIETKRVSHIDNFDFNYLGIPELLDNLRFDLIHHHAQLGDSLGPLLNIYNTLKSINDSLSPSEYGVTPKEKMTIGYKIAKYLLIKILHDVTLVNHTTSYPTNILSPNMDMCRNRDLLYASLVSPSEVDIQYPKEGDLLSPSNLNSTDLNEASTFVRAVASASASAASIAATALAISSVTGDREKLLDSNTSTVGGLKPSDMFTTSPISSNSSSNENIKVLNSSKMSIHKDNSGDSVLPYNQDYSSTEHSVHLLVNQARELGIRSPYRMVRSRYYVTSASHMYSLLNIFVHAKDNDGEGILDPQFSSNVQLINNLHYLSHIVLRVWERKTSIETPFGQDNHRLEILVSTGAKGAFGKDLSDLSRNEDRTDVTHTDAKHDKPAHAAHINRSTSVDKYVPSYYQLAPLMTLTLDCPLFKFEKIITDVIESS